MLRKRHAEANTLIAKVEYELADMQRALGAAMAVPLRERAVKAAVAEAAPAASKAKAA